MSSVKKTSHSTPKKSPTKALRTAVARAATAAADYISVHGHSTAEKELVSEWIRSLAAALKQVDALDAITDKELKAAVKIALNKKVR